MGERFLRWGLGGERVATSVRGTAPQGSVAQIRLRDVPLVPDPAGGTALVAILYPLADVELQAVRLTPVSGSGSAVVEQTSLAGDTAWLTYLSIGTGSLDNGGLQTMEARVTAPWATSYPYPLARLDGPALGAHGVPITAINVDATYTTASARGVWGPLEFGGLVDDTTNVLPDVTAALAALVPTILNAPGTVTIGAGATGDVLAYEAGFVGLSPDRLIWARAGDIGNATYQLPQAAANNSASHYKFFPSFFLRRCSYERDLYVAGPIEAEPVTTLAGALPIMGVLRRPTHSRWLFVIDGQVRDVVVSHGELDVRRPLEIWQAVIVPAIRAGSIATYGVEASAGNLSYPRQGTISNLAYLDAARFIEPLDGNGTDPLYLPIPQT